MMKTPRGTSESSTTSDNTAEFIEIVKTYDIVYNTHNPDYKNVEVKLKVWSKIADEIGLSVDAAKRKWKNLRDSYTKYLRSYRSGGKTSKKYQFWAHAEHMEFLKPYQGPGRNCNVVNSKEDINDNDSDLAYQTTNKLNSCASDEKKQVVPLTSLPVITTMSSTIPSAIQTVAAIPPIQCSVPSSTMMPQISNSMATSFGNNLTTHSFGNNLTTTASSAMVMPIPSLPTVPLPPQFAMKPLLPQISTSLPNHLMSSSTIPQSSMPSIPSLPSMSNPSMPPPTPTLPPSIFPLPQMPNNSKAPIPSLPPVTTATSVGCLIFDPQLLSSIDSFKKDMGTQAIGLLTNLTPQMSTHTNSSTNNTTNCNSNSTKIRRVQPSPQAVNFSLPSAPNQNSNSQSQPPAKWRKLSEQSENVDISAILQANRELDTTTLFFLSLASTVRSMPTKFQSLAKMRCMRIVSDIELELENAENDVLDIAKNRLCDTPSPPNILMPQPIPLNESAPTEHFVYCMSPSRIENMIDISSDDETAISAGQMQRT